MDPRAQFDRIEAARARSEVRARLFGAVPAPVVVGRFVVLERVGRGAMGVVYAARDPELDRKVALKLLHGAGAGRPLLAEAKALARLRHPNVVSVYEVGTYEGETFVAMEHVEGESLAAWLEAAPRAWRDVISVFAAAGRGLAAAHAAGLVHRDFKPENVVVGADGQPRVVDFGLARSADDAGPPPEGERARSGEGSATQSRLAGTPTYMAPELFAGGRATARSDQYAFCVALYRALWKVSPFEAERRAPGDPAPQPRRPPRSGVPARIQRAVLQGLSPRPESRHPDMRPLLEALEDRRRTRGVAVAAALALAASAVALGARSQSPATPICAAGEARLGAVWSPDARARMAGAFVASKRPFAPEVLRTVERRIDAYGRDWVTMYRDSCEATHVRGDQSRELLDLRTHCLERCRAALGVTVSALTASDPAVVEHSLSLVEALPSLERCADVPSLSSAVRPPDDPPRRARLAELERALDDARAAFVAGKLGDAARRAGDLSVEARRLDHAPFVGEVAFLAGSIASAQGRYEAAEAALVLAVKSGQASGHADLVARAATKLLGVTGVQRMEPEKARIWRDLADASVARAADRRLSAELEDRIAAVLHEEGKVDLALVHVERAATILEQMGGATTSTYASYLSDWGNVLDSKGDYGAALQRLGRALELREALLGPSHPDVARTLNNIAVVHGRKDQLELARVTYERAIAIAESVGGMDLHAAFLDNLAGTLLQLGRTEEAFERRLRAHAMRERDLPPDHPEIGMSWNNLGNAYQRVERLDESLAAYEKALAIFRAAHGPEHVEVARALGNTGEIHEARGDLERALERFRQAAEMKERTTHGEHPSFAWSLAAQGRVEGALGRHALAIPHLERAIAIFERHGAHAEELGKARFALARALWDSGQDRKHARAMAEKARAGPFAGDVSELTSAIDAWLAARPAR